MRPGKTGDLISVPDYIDIIELSKYAAPIPLEKVENSYVSFMPAEYIESLPKDAVDMWRSEIEILPWTITFSCNHKKTMEFSWFTHWKDSTIRVKVEIPIDQNFADLTMNEV